MENVNSNVSLSGAVGGNVQAIRTNQQKPDRQKQNTRPSKGISNGNRQIQCFRCGRMGHMGKDCVITKGKQCSQNVQELAILSSQK